MMCTNYNFVGKYFHYVVQPLNKLSIPAVSVIDCLMTSQRELKWPDAVEARNNKLKMRNDLINFFKSKGLGWK